MRYQESIQLYTYKHKTYIVQFKIESSKYDRFKYKFTTDKYINLVQWEFIMAKINKAVVGVYRKPNEWENKNNRFTFDDLIISYEFVNKSEGIINYEKINYEFDWIVQVTINKSSTQDTCNIQESQTSCNIQESQTSTSSPRKRSSSSSKESIVQNDENKLIIDDSDDDHIHECKKARMNEDDTFKSSVLQQSNHIKPRKEKSDKGRQTSITSFVTNRKDKPKPQKPKESKPSTSKDALDQLDQYKLQQMNDFVERSVQEEKKKEERKEELKDYEIWSCHKMSNEQIVEIIKKLETEIDYLFSNSSEFLSSRNFPAINACDITASNIITEKQSMFVLNTISKLHTKDDFEPCDNTLLNVALPRVIIELFKKHHNLSTEEAIERIKTQEEKKILYKEEFNESY